MREASARRAQDAGFACARCDCSLGACTSRPEGGGCFSEHRKAHHCRCVIVSSGRHTTDAMTDALPGTDRQDSKHKHGTRRGQEISFSNRANSASRSSAIL